VLLWTTGPLTGDGPAAAFATSAVAVAVAYRTRPSWGRVLAITLLAGAAVSTKSLLVGPALLAAWWLVATRRRWLHMVIVPVGALAVVGALSVPWGIQHVLDDYVRYHLDKTTNRKPGANFSKLWHTFFQRDTFLAALCGPQYRTVIESELGREGLERAERDCGYCFFGEIPSLVGWDFDEQLALRIEQPVHLVAGGDSPPFNHRLVNHLAAMLPDARITVIPGHNHLLPLTAPTALAELTRNPVVTA
jgi:pimeloyl-ACP methyl ester carboxylesterase